MSQTSPPIILLVEDNRDDVLIFKRALKKAKIDCPLVILNNGQEAIDYLAGIGSYSDRGSYPLPSLMVLDLKMPLKTGFDVLEWRSQPANDFTPRIPAVVLSSSDEPQDVNKAMALGASAYLAKPPNPEQLVKIFETNVGKISVCQP